jgi:hypothetical protein
LSTSEKTERQTEEALCRTTTQSLFCLVRFFGEAGKEWIRDGLGMDGLARAGEAPLGR